MGRKKKPFIDNRSAVTFEVVPRSQRDPLINSTSSTSNILVPQESSGRRHDRPLSTEERLAEQAKYGIYFEDDDYDYLQHLKDVNEVEDYPTFEEHYRIFRDGQVLDSPDRVLIPSSMLPSRGVQLKVGLLNQAAPESGLNLDVDPDVSAAMDDDFDFNHPDNQLEDDFVLRANAEDPTAAASCQSTRIRRRSRRRLCSGFSDLSSVTSSSINRLEHLQLLDRQFEKIMEEYEINETDEEFEEDDSEPEKPAANIKDTDSVLHRILEDYKADELNDEAQLGAADEERTDVKPRTLELAYEEKPCYEVIQEKPKKRAFDCESVISLCSNLYNHPTVIDTPVKKRKHSLAGSVMSDREGSVRSSVGYECRPMSISTFRSNVRDKGESAEEKRLRKKLTKEEARERRAKKKTTKMAFKTEELRNRLLEVNTLRNLREVKLD